MIGINAFRNSFYQNPVITLQEIKKRLPNFDKKALVRWQKKGYLRKIRNGYYLLSSPDLKLDEPLCYLIANRIYSPSYVSIESAFSHYNLIPEGVFRITSIATKKTIAFDTPVGYFQYQHLQPKLFFGYRLYPVGQHSLYLAELEKCILDYFYLHPQIDTLEDLNGLRWRKDVLRSIDWSKLADYLSLFSQNRLNRTIITLKQYTYDSLR